LAKKKNIELRKLGLTCTCGECDLAKFTLQEIKDIIFLEIEEDYVNEERI